MKKRRNISSGTPWEKEVGYSRAVRVGNIVEVAGTTAVEGQEIMFPYEPYEQTHYILMKIDQTLQDAGASLKDVVRTRIYVTNILWWPEIGRAHREIFRNINPAATMVEVSQLIDERLMVEIEATAIIAEA